MIDQISVLVLGVVTIALGTMLVYIVERSVTHAREESERLLQAMNKLMVTNTAKSPAEAADALSALAHNEEALRQHAETFEIERAQYAQTVKDKPKAKPPEHPSGPIVKDLHTGHNIEIIT